MGWFSGNKTSVPPAQEGSTQVIQKSHQPLDLTLDISHTLEQIADSKAPKVVTANENPQASIEEFVKKNENKTFIIDGEKYTKESIICTSNNTGGKTCLKLGISSIELFKSMQKLDYFCSLPNDIDATYFECRKIN